MLTPDPPSAVAYGGEIIPQKTISKNSTTVVTNLVTIVYICFVANGFCRPFNKMLIFNKSSIIEFSRKHSGSKKQLILWYNDVFSKRWKTPNDVKADFAAASIINKQRVVFNIKGNDYRLIAEINYAKGWLFIKFIGTHAEYDKVDAASVNLYGPGKRK